LLLFLLFPSIAYDVCITLHTVLSFFWSLEGVVVTLVIRFRRAGDKNTRITTHEHEVLFFLLLPSFFFLPLLVRAPFIRFFLFPFVSPRPLRIA
jgi:heme/copper-type cytochrome/quinol oxidase subunit 2